MLYIALGCLFNFLKYFSCNMEINLEVKTMTFAYADVFRNRPALKNFENFL